MLALGLTLAVSGAGLAQAATGGGGSSSGGSGGGLLDSASTVMVALDGFNGVGQPTLQGRGQSSIDYFWGQTVAVFQQQLSRTPGSQGVQTGQTPRASFNAVCGDALQNAADRATAMGYPATAADSRVVGIYFSYAVGSTNWFMSSVPGSEYSGSFAPSFSNEVSDPALPGFAYDGDRDAYARIHQKGVPALDAIAATWRSHVDGVIASHPSSGRYFTCVALNEFEPQVEFQPTISTQVTTRFVNKGETFGDDVTVAVAAGDQWASGATLRARGTVAGPVTGEQPRAATIPAGTPVADTLWLDFDQPGTKRATWTAPVSGTYAFVWEIRKSDSEANGRYVRADASDAYMAPTEITTARINPQLSTQVRDRYVDTPGAPIVDNVTIGLPAGDLWPTDAAGNNLPLRVRVTAYDYQARVTAPVAAAPAGTAEVGTEFVTFTNVGTKPTAGAIRRPMTGNGWLPLVAEVRLVDQTPEMRDRLQSDVRDLFMLENETVSARRNLEHYSEVREYNVVIGGRAFDTITMNGFPADQGAFKGSGSWPADVTTASVTTYYSPTGRFDHPTQAPAGTQVLTSTTIPARNGTFNIGFTEADIINPNLPGHYVVQYCFGGDGRTAPFCSRLDDIREQFYVPTDGSSWFDMMSTATQNATAGEGKMSDTVLVTGNAVPAGTTLTWQRCLWVDPAAPGCTDPVNSHSVTVPGSGFYNHPEIDPPTLAEMPAGHLEAYSGWAPIWTDPNGVVLDREPFGTPAQTTRITAELPSWSSQATPTANVGDIVTDVVTFDGPTRSDWTVQWEACWLDADDVCAEGTSFTLSDPIPVDPAQDSIESQGWKVEVPAGTKPGTKPRLGHQPILRDAFDTELLREPWGTEGQVTVVDYPLPSMTSQATETVLLGETTKDTVTITGPVEEGSRITWSGCYWIEVEDGTRECRQDATPVADVPENEDGTTGLVLPALALGETLTVESPEHETTYGGLLPDLGLRFSWAPRIADPDGEVLVQEAAGLPTQTTVVEFPPIKVTTKAYSLNPDGPYFGDEIGDVIEITGDILPGDEVTVRLFAWETGTLPICTVGTEIATVKPGLTPALSTYDTGPAYRTPTDRRNLVYGFVETTVSRGTTTVSKCGLEAETLYPTVDPASWSDSASGHLSQASGALAVTGARNVGLLFALAAVLTLAGASLVRARDQHRKRQPAKG